MKNFDWKKLIPHAIAIAIFLIVALLYCKPALEGKVLQQSDIMQWKGMSADLNRYKETHGEVSLWTKSMFSGMPGYLIATQTNNDVPYLFAQALSLFLGKPFQFFFLACVCFYFLSQVLRVNNWIGVIGALTYAYATYNVVIVSVGHDTKMLSIALLPGFIGALILIYEKKYLWGAALTSLFTGSLIAQNHYQIVYYGIIAAFIMTVAYVIHWIKNKEFKHFALAGVITLASGLVGVLSNAVVILPNYEYTQQTIRGGSALAESSDNVGKEGLSKSYAFSYSMQMAEPFVLMLPRMFGGSSNHLEIEETESKAIEALQSMQPQVAQQLQGNLSFYWGEAHTSGPPYAGAVICFFAIMGFVVLDNKHKWWIAATLLLTAMMSWGSNFEGFNNFLFNHLPMYNKFRAPGMIIVIPTLLVGMMAVMALHQLLFVVNNRPELTKKMKEGFYATAAVFVVLILIYFSLDYRSAAEEQLMQSIQQIPDAAQRSMFEENARTFINALVQDRQSLFMGDLIRSLLFIAAAALAIWLFRSKTINRGVVLLAVGLLAFIDVMAIDVKYLNADNYQEAEVSDAAFYPTPADQQILQDTSYYRVFNIVGGNIPLAFNHGALTSYFHNSIGGYHPAKLSIYQDLIEKQLYNFPQSMPVVNMLNTKYIIYGDAQNPQVQVNPEANGAVWFVKGVRFVKGAQAEMQALNGLNTKDTAIAQQQFADILKTGFNQDTAATIKLIKNDNDIVTYQSRTATEQLAVFSEIYYDKGWNAYIDGKEVPYARVNYVLRGMMVPAGEHTIVFKFEPKSHALGWTLTTIASVIMVLLLLAAILFSVKKKKALHT